MTPRVRGHTRVAIDRGWELAATPSGTCREPRDLGGAVWQPAAVPGTAAGVLRAAGAWNLDDRRRFDAEDWWWRVHLPPRDARARLGFDGVATLWDAWLDGEWIAHGDSMHEARVVDLPAAGSELVLRCRSLDAELTRKRPRPRWRVPMIEHVQLRWFRTTLLGRTPGWSPACAAVGPWRAVWIEAADSGVGVVNVEARVEAGIGFVTVGAQLPEGTAGATLVVARGATRVTRELACEQGAWVGSAAVREPARWWPHTHGEPARYDLHLELAGGAVIELGAIGFRTIAIDRGADGRDFAVHVNGVPVFCRGACWTPLDPVALAAPRAAYDAAVAQLAAAGLNMLRVGGTMIYEDDALYDALDARGVLLWQDFMFAAMDYPEDDPAFRATALAEVDAQCLRLQARPSLAIACGNSEVSQQAAMGGAIRERWTPPLFEHAIAERVRAVVPGVAYVPSSAHGGEFPHDPGAGTTSYYGVGAYRRGLADARASGVVFASECLAFANIPAGELPPPGSPAWKARVPRDAGASWDFDDVRDHYVHELYGVDPEPLRATDPDRYLALGRAATGEVMARTFAEWRRAGSHCRGALVWFARDLAPGAGWGLVAADGTPKPCWWYVRRACAPRALAISDEGAAGLALHVVNDAAEPLAGTLELALWRGGDVPVGRAARAIEVAPRAALELAAVELFDHWEDLSWAYRFGPPVADLVHLRLGALEAFWFPGHLPAAREPDIGLAVAPANGGIVLTATRFAQTIAIEGALEGAAPDDNYFHLAPGAVRTIAVRGAGTVTALNSERVLVFSAP